MAGRPRGSSVSDHDRLVQLIYDGADDPRGLEDALVEIAGKLGAEMAQSFVIENGTTLLDHRFHGAPESMFDEYFEWQDKDPRFAAALGRPGVVLSDSVDIDRGSFERSAIFNEYLRKYEICNSMFGIFPVAPNVILATAVFRPLRCGPFARSATGHLTALMPHLRRTTRLRRLVQAMQGELDDLRRALDVLPSGVAILDHAGKVVCANACAEALFREPGGIRTEHGKLTASTSAARGALSAAIARAVEGADAGSRRPASAAVAPTIDVPLGPDAGAPSLAVVLHGLRPRSALREGPARAARVLVVFHDPRRRIRLNPALVAKVYGLTPTEAALATELAEGLTLADFAITRGCTEQTARTHLKRILDKTGTHRQSDLVRLLLTGAAMHGFQ